MNRNESNLSPVFDFLIHRPHASTSEPPPTLGHLQSHYHTFYSLPLSYYPLCPLPLFVYIRSFRPTPVRRDTELSVRQI